MAETIILKDQYGNPVEVAIEQIAPGRFSIIADAVENIPDGSKYLIYEDPWGTQTPIALSELEDGRYAIAISLPNGGGGTVGDPGDLVALFNSNL